MIEEGGGASRSTTEASGSSAATDVSLREHVELRVALQILRLEERFTYVEKLTEQAFDNSQRAIDKADLATEKRFEGVNEFRAALSDQATNFVTVETLAAQIERMESNYRRNREDIDMLTDRMNLREGQSQGSRITTGILVTVVTVGVGVIGLVVVLANYISSH